MGDQRETTNPGAARAQAGQAAPVEAPTQEALSQETLSQEDRSLVRALKRGSRAAFVRLLRRESNVVRGALVRHIERLADVDDLAQEVFLTAFRGIDRFEGRSSLRSWLLGIAHKRALTFRRNEGRRRAKEEDVAQQRLCDWEIEHLEGQKQLDGERLQRLRQCVQRLGERQRNLIERFYFRGESAEAIAHEGDRNSSAIRMALLRVRGILRACVERDAKG